MPPVDMLAAFDRLGAMLGEKVGGWTNTQNVGEMERVPGQMGEASRNAC